MKASNTVDNLRGTDRDQAVLLKKEEKKEPKKKGE